MVYLTFNPFSGLTLLVEWQEGDLVWKKTCSSNFQRFRFSWS